MTKAQEEKVFENRLRRMAARQGLKLAKSRRRDPRALDYGSYGLYGRGTDVLKVGDRNTGYGLTLGEVEQALTGDVG